MLWRRRGTKYTFYEVYLVYARIWCCSLSQGGVFIKYILVRPWAMDEKHGLTSPSLDKYGISKDDIAPALYHLWYKYEHGVK